MIKGILRYEYGGDEQFVFVREDGAVVNGVENVANTPINVEILAEFEGRKLVRYEWASDTRADVDTNRLSIAVIRCVDKESEITDELKASIQERADNLAEFYYLQEGHRIEVEAAPYIVVHKSPGLISFQTSDPEVRDQLDAQSGSWERHNHIHGIGGYKSSLNGHAYLGAGKSWTFLNGPPRTDIHEVGHGARALYRGHSWSGSAMYGGNDIMANANAGMNVLHRLGFGSFPEHAMGEITKSQTVFVAPIEIHPDDLRNGEVQAAKITVGSYKYVLSSRKTWDQSLIGAERRFDEGTLYVHRPRNLSWTSKETDFITALKPGEAVNLGGGVHVTNDEHRDGVVRALVRIGTESVRDKMWPRALDPIRGVPITSMHSAIWYNSEHRYQGFIVLVHSATKASVYWFTHHPRGEHRDPNNFQIQRSGRQWFVGDMDIHDGYMAGTIYKPTADEDNPVGQGTLFFSGEDSGLFRSYTTSFGRVHTRLTRLSPAFEQNYLRGIWEPEGVSNEGFVTGMFLTDVDDDSIKEQVACYYFGYAGDEQTWETASGEAVSETEANMVRYSLQGRFMSPYFSSFKDIGTAQFKAREKDGEILWGDRNMSLRRVSH